MQDHFFDWMLLAGVIFGLATLGSILVEQKHLADRIAPLEADYAERRHRKAGRKYFRRKLREGVDV